MRHYAFGYHYNTIVRCDTTRLSYCNVKTRLVDLVGLFWLKQMLMLGVGLLIDIGLGFECLLEN